MNCLKMSASLVPDGSYVALVLDAVLLNGVVLFI
jgi:hypothetical protein